MSDQGSSRGRYAFFVIAALGLLMSSIDSTIVAVAIPSMTQSLNTSLGWIGWTLTSYQLAQIVVMPLAGKLSDGLGRKRVFMFCVGSFTLGSLLCGVAPSIGFLIIFRVIQAIGGGGLMPSAVGIVSDQFKENRNQAIGLFTSVFPIGGIVGPVLGGWILEHWSWREIFFVNLPIGVLILIGAHLLLRDRRQGELAHRIDVPGLVLFSGGMVTVMYAMTEVGNDSSIWQRPIFWAMVVGGLILFWLFVRQEARAEQPVVDLDLVVRWPFLPANLYNFVFGACIFGAFSFIPYFAVVQYQMSPTLSGAVLTPRALVMIFVAAGASMLLMRLGYRLPMIVGMLFVTVTLVLLSFGWTQVTIGPLTLNGFWLVAAEIAVSGLGMGLASPASNNASIDLLPSKAAAITGLRGMFRLTGGIIGVSSVVLILSFYQDKAAGMRVVFLGLAILLQATIPLTMMIPDLDRRRRRREAAIEGPAGRLAAAEEPVAASRHFE